MGGWVVFYDWVGLGVGWWVSGRAARLGLGLLGAQRPCPAKRGVALWGPVLHYVGSVLHGGHGRVAYR